MLNSFVQETYTRDQIDEQIHYILNYGKGYDWSYVSELTPFRRQLLIERINKQLKSEYEARKAADEEALRKAKSSQARAKRRR